MTNAAFTTEPTETERHQQAIEIAATARLVKKGASWLVPSQSQATKYSVVLNDEGGFCTCKDHSLTGRRCKHQIAVQIVIKRELNENGEEEVKAGFRVTYSQQSWSAYNEAQTSEKELFMKLYRQLCAGIPQPKQGRGRPRHSVADMVFAAGLKVYRGNSARRFAGDIQDAKACGLITKAPHFNALIDYFNDATITPYLYEMVRVSALPLKEIESDFAIDSTGFSSTQLVGQWKGAKYGEKQQRMAHDWLKVHAMTGVRTNVVVAVEVTEANTGDAPRLRPLLESTVKDFEVNHVLGDKAYSSYANLDFAADHGVTPVVMFRDNATGNTGSETWDKLLHYYRFHRRDFMKAYHKRSNVEATFSAIKRVFGDFVRSKNKTAQINEILLKIICHNIRQLIFAIHELGIDPSFRAELRLARQVAE
jgi:transposase